MFKETYELSHVKVEPVADNSNVTIWATLFIKRTLSMFGIKLTSSVRCRLCSIDSFGNLVCSPNSLLTEEDLRVKFGCSILSTSPLRISNSLNEPIEWVFEDIIKTMFSNSCSLVNRTLSQLFAYEPGKVVRLVSVSSNMQMKQLH